MVRIFGIREYLDPVKGNLSAIIAECMAASLDFPPGKRAHRFFPMAADDFYYPEGRSPAYTVIEIALMSGRSVAARKALIHALFERCERDLGIAPIDLEITLFEVPPGNWGFRGMSGDEASLDYRVDV